MNILRIIWSVLDRRQRVRALCLVLLMFVGAFLEVVGVGLVVPALSLMAGDGVPAADGWMARVTSSYTAPQLIGIGLGMLFAVQLLKTVVLLLLAYLQSRFLTSMQNGLARRLFSIYLHQPWTFHLGRNSAELIRTMAEAGNLASTFSMLMGMASDSMMVAGVIGLLLWIEPVGTLVVAAVFAVAMWTLAWFTSGRLKRWGQARFRLAAEVSKQQLQGLGGAKDVLISGRQATFLDRFDRYQRELSRINVRNIVIQQLPRMWLELVAVSMLCLLAGAMLWEGRTGQQLVVSLGLFAAAAFRLLPPANRVSSAVQNMRFSAAGIEAIRRDLALPVVPPRRGDRVSFERSIDLENVLFRFPGSEKPALDGVTIRVPRGTAVGIIGGSGAGKSTLVDVLLGLLSPESGAVLVDGADIRGNTRGWQDIVGYVPQSIYLCDDTLQANVAFGIPPEQVDPAALDRALKAARLDDLVASLPKGKDTIVGERGVRLSGGQRQRIGIARALYHEPAVLVLDEATSALDTQTESEVMEAVNSLHGATTLVIIAHRLTTVEHCDVLYRLEQGRVVRTGSYAEVVGS